MRALLAATLLVAVTSAASAASSVVIIDGDTIAIGDERIRILSIDTPETFRSRCENELLLGLRAKERLRELLDSGEIRIERDGHDRYHRSLADVFVGRVNVGETLLREGFALPYQPGAAAKLERLKVWCGSNATLEMGKWAGGIASAEEHRPPHRASTGAPWVRCKWIITPTWGPSWCGNPNL